MMRLSLLALLIVTLSGCQLLRPAQDASSVFPASVHDMSQWQLKGRFGYRAGNDGGSASMHWQQQQDNGNIHFSGPLGFGSAEIQWRPDYAALTNGKGTVEANDTASLAWRLTGLWLPVEALQYWVRGLPFPESDINGSADFNTQGQLSSLQQLGWQLDFERYESVSDGIVLPHKIRATQNDQRFTLIISEWALTP